MKLLECKPKLNKWRVQGVLDMADNQGNLADRTQAIPRQQMEVPDKGYVNYGLSSTNICQLRACKTDLFDVLGEVGAVLFSWV